MFRKSILLKILAPMFLFLALLMAVSGILSFRRIGRGVREQLEASLRTETDSLVRLFDTSRSQFLDKLSSDLRVANYLFYLEGGITVADETVSLQATNQITQEIKPVVLAGWELLGREIHGDFTFVDLVQELTDATVTVFQKIDGGYLRISTNVLKLDGQRATGTYIPDDSPVIRTIESGETFFGRAFVVNDWYLTAYEPIVIDREVRGILYVGVKEKDLDLLRQAVEEIRIGQSGYAFAVDRGGEFILHPTLGGTVHESPEWVDGAFESGSGTDYGRNAEGKQTIVTYRVYEPFDLVVAITALTEEFLGEITATQLIASIGSSIVLFIAIFLVLFVILRRFIIRPISAMAESLEELSSDEGDLTRRLAVLADDEIGQLSKGFNRFMDNLDDIIKRVGTATRVGNTMSIQLAASAEQSTAALTQIRSNIRGMAERSRALDKQVEDSRKGADELATASGDVRQQTESQSSAINQSSASIEEMSASIQNVARSMSDRMELTEHLSRLVGRGQEEMDTTSVLINQVTDSTQVIMDMVQVINQIAEQTNLLAMNAAIEAAHAGDQGRGFAVVADEIRKLAESTGSNAREISDSLQGIVDSIHTTEEASGRTQKYFLEIVDGISNVTDAMREIRTTMDELSTGSAEVASALAEIVSSSEAVRHSTDVIDGKVKALDENLSGAAAVSVENRSGMDEMDVGVEEVLKAVQQVSEGSTENAGNMKAIDEKIGQFRTSDDS